ncbi:MAG TPA: YegS/Rv2252/BmrU family lipid kinase [Bacteroidales bacterium]|nr:YegS/Rv2252/BmrU family lipid kinase [Bacteroidales bacterium]
MAGEKQKILFVINPVSGNIDKVRFEKNIVELADEMNYEFLIYKTTSTDDASALKSEIEDFKPETVVVAGGDGTLNMVAQLLIGTKIKMGIIPLGSANGMAAELGIPDNWHRALQIVFKGHAHSIDMVRINRKYLSIHVSDLGLNARVIKRYTRQRWHGLFGYARQFFREMFLSQPVKYYITADGRKYFRRAHMVAIANAKKYGTGAILNPLGRLDDGRFEICIFKPYPFYAIFTFLIAFFTGTLHKHRYVKIISCSHAKITVKHKQDLQIDGEAIGEVKSIQVDILSKVLQIIVP